MKKINPLASKKHFWLLCFSFRRYRRKKSRGKKSLIESKSERKAQKRGTWWNFTRELYNIEGKAKIEK